MFSLDVVVGSVTETMLRAQPPIDEFEELRIALVMNGGVSLAVWMGGVAMELNRLVRHDPYQTENPGREPDLVAASVYGGVLGLIGARPRVDVIAGASAGGLNGALLGTALAHDKDLQPLYRLWLEQGDMERLLRSPTEADPPSLLMGDAYFLPRLKEAFASVSEGRLRRADEVPLRLTMTTTLITGQIHQLIDELGSTLPDELHRGEFRFNRGPGIDDDFQRKDIVERLALAGRSTASFPGAFEASFIPIESPTVDPPRPAMRGTADFTMDRYVMDGGVLVNKPIKPVMRSIFAQPAGDRPVRRVLVYVVPDPGTFPKDIPDDITSVPSMRDVVTHVLTLPKVQSISGEISDIQAHNQQAWAQRRVRTALMTTSETTGALRELAGGLYPTYRRLRASDVVDTVVGNVSPEHTLSAGLTERVWAAIRDAVGTGTTAWLPLGDSRPAPVAAWPYGSGALEHAAITALDLINRGLALARNGPQPVRERVPDLARFRGGMHELIAAVGDARRREDDWWRDEAAALVDRGWSDVQAASQAALAGRVAEWLRGRPQPADMRDRTELAVGIASGVLSALPVLAEVAAGTAGQASSASDAATLTAIVDGFGVKGGTDQQHVLERLADLGIVQYTLAAGMPVVEQTSQFVILSAFTPNGIDAPETVRNDPRGKVAGIQLSHFGAFYKRTWRANDWMWGRIDATTRLCQVALDPERLRWAVDRATSKDQAVDYAIARIDELVLPRPAGDGPADADADADVDARPLLEVVWKNEREAARAELAYLASDEDSPPPVLEVCARALARRLQLDLVRTELPKVADAIDHDVSAGAILQPATRDFLDAIRKVHPTSGSDPLSAAGGWELFRRCRVGEERIAGDLGSDLFLRTSSTAAAVGVNAVAGKRSGLKPIQPITRTIRSVVLLIYMLMQSAVAKTKGGYAAMMLLLALGGSLVAVDVLAPGVSRVLLYVGLVLIGGGLLLAGLRAGAVRLAVYLFAWMAGSASLYAVALHLTTGHPKLTWVPPLVATVALVAGSMLLGTIRRRGQRANVADRSRRLVRPGVLVPLIVGVASGVTITVFFVLPIAASIPLLVASLTALFAGWRWATSGSPVRHDSLDARLAAGIAALNEGRTAEAERTFASVVDVGRLADRASLNLGILYAIRGDLRRAADAFLESARAADEETAARAALALGILTLHGDDPAVVSAAFRDAMRSATSDLESERGGYLSRPVGPVSP